MISAIPPKNPRQYTKYSLRFLIALTKILSARAAYQNRAMPSKAFRPTTVFQVMLLASLKFISVCGTLVPRPLGAFAWLLHCLIYKVQGPLRGMPALCASFANIPSPYAVVKPYFRISSNISCIPRNAVYNKQRYGEKPRKRSDFPCSNTSRKPTSTASIW